MKPARLIAGILVSRTEIFSHIEALLSKEFGPILLRSPDLPWNFSRYYEGEMGPNITRRWVCHSPFVLPHFLPIFKRKTREIEDSLRDPQGRRQANLDPGILTLHNLVLATTKDYTHRICIEEGLYAEVTLIYHKGRYEPLPWTYPDYKTETCLDFLTTCRTLLLRDRKWLHPE